VTVKSLNNSDGSYSAIIVKFNYDATVPYVYKIFISKPGENIDFSSDSDVLRLDEIDGIVFEWSDLKTLTIECISGKIYKYNNFSFINNENIKINLNTNCMTHARSPVVNE
jgi:hypothetical protein